MCLLEKQGIDGILGLVVINKSELLQKLRPYKVRPAEDETPDRWETGTQNHESMAGVC